jgi:hypothetical protein
MSFTLYIVLDAQFPNYLDLAILAEGRRYGIHHLGTESEGEQRQISLRVPGLVDQLESYVRDVQIVLQSHLMVHPAGQQPKVAMYLRPDDADDVRSRLEKLL